MIGPSQRGSEAGAAPASPIVCFPFVGDAVGGSHLSALALVARLPEAGYQPLVLVHHAGPLTAELDRLGIAWQGIVTPPSMLMAGRAIQLTSLIASARFLAKTLRTHGATIVHTNDARMHRTWVTAARMAGVHHVWHQRNAGVSWKMAQLARMSHAVLAVSQFAAQSLPSHLSHRAHVVDNPFDVTQKFDRVQARALLQEEMHFDAGTAVVAFAGHFIHRKQPKTFVDVAAMLVERGVDAVFPMFGPLDGPEIDAVKSAIHAHGLEDRVRLMGFRSPIEPWLAGCDILVSPSLSEPFARVVVEAMIVGTPVAAVDDGGNAEIIETWQNGVLVAPGDAVTFAAAVARLLADSQQRAALAKAARRTVEARFSVDRHVATISRVYATLVDPTS